MVIGFFPILADFMTCLIETVVHVPEAVGHVLDIPAMHMFGDMINYRIMICRFQIHQSVIKIISHIIIGSGGSIYNRIQIIMMIIIFINVYIYIHGYVIKKYIIYIRVIARTPMIGVSRL